MSRSRIIRELIVLFITVLAIAHAIRSIGGSLEHQLFLRQQSQALKTAHSQAQDVNKELREGLANYRSSAGIERLARERLNLAAADEVIVRIGK